MEEPPSFSAWLRTQRRSQGWTQHAFAQKVGYSFSTIRKFETGDLRPSSAAARDLARVFAIPDTHIDAFVAFARGEGTITAFHPHPPAAPPAPAPSLEHPIPAPFTPLIGRDQACARLHGWLASVTHRLIVIAGPPGVGKTRLAQEVGHWAMEHLALPTAWIDLRPLTYPDALADQIFSLAPPCDAGGTPTLAQRCIPLRTHLPSPTLIILDNVERHLDAIDLLTTIAAHVPQVRWLITSQAALDLAGVHTLTLAPLSVPPPAGALTPDDIPRYPALALLVERIQDTVTGYQPGPADIPFLVRICRAVDGLPLALELIARRLQAVALPQIAEQIEALPAIMPLRDSIAGNVALLPVEAATAFHCIGAFAPMWDLDAFRAVCGVLLTPSQVADALYHLLRFHCIQRLSPLDAPQPRFSCLESIQRYAEQCLAAHPQRDAIRTAHRQYYQRLLTAATADRTAEPSNDGITHAMATQPNVERAIRYLQAHGDPADLGQLLLDLALLWKYAPAQRMNTRYLETILASSPQIPAATRGVLWSQLGIFHHMDRDFLRSQVAFEAALAIAETLGDPGMIAEALKQLGANALQRDQPDVARALFERGLSLLQREAADHRPIMVDLTCKLGVIHALREEWEAGAQAFEAALALAQRHDGADDPFLILYNLGYMRYMQGAWEEAERQLNRCLPLVHGLPLRRAYVETTRASIALEHHQHAQALAACFAVLDLYPLDDPQPSVFDCLEVIACVMDATDAAAHACGLLDLINNESRQRAIQRGEAGRSHFIQRRLDAIRQRSGVIPTPFLWADLVPTLRAQTAHLWAADT